MQLYSPAGKLLHIGYLVRLKSVLNRIFVVNERIWVLKIKKAFRGKNSIFTYRIASNRIVKKFFIQEQVT